MLRLFSDRSFGFVPRCCWGEWRTFYTLSAIRQPAIRARAIAACTRRDVT